MHGLIKTLIEVLDTSFQSGSKTKDIDYEFYVNFKKMIDEDSINGVQNLLIEDNV